jgi:SAM-dependent methyltransferase
VLVRHAVIPWQELLDRCKGHASILDIGCGHGLFLHLLKRRHPEMICVGYDHDRAKIRSARRSQKTPNLFFLSARHKDALRGMNFDCVALIDVLYAIPFEKWPATLKLARDCLKPGGSLLLKETVNIPAWKYRLCLFQENMAIKVLGYTKGQDPILPSIAEYRRILNANGFHIRQDLPLDRGYLWPHHLFLARKADTPR